MDPNTHTWPTNQSHQPPILTPDQALYNKHIADLRQHQITKAPITISMWIDGIERRQPVTLDTLDEQAQLAKFNTQPHEEIYTLYDACTIMEFIYRMIGQTIQTPPNPMISSQLNLAEEMSSDFDVYSQSLLGSQDNSPMIPHSQPLSETNHSQTLSSDSAILLPQHFYNTSDHLSSSTICLPHTTYGAIDVLFIDQLRELEAPNLSFMQFCLYKNYIHKIVTSGQKLGFPTYYKQAIQNDDLEIIEAFVIWKKTFWKHKTPFDHWFLESRPKEEIDKTVAQNTEIMKAMEAAINTTSIPNSPHLPFPTIQNLKRAWSATYSVSHNLKFETWLRETEENKFSFGPYESDNNIESFFIYNNKTIPTSKHNLIKSITSYTHQQTLFHLQQSLDNNSMWTLDWEKYYIPPYPIIPYGLREDFNIVDLMEDNNSRHCAWRMIRDAYVTKITTEQKKIYKKYKTIPLMNMYKRSKDRICINPNEIPLPYYILNQHIQAHKYLQSVRSSGRLANFEFYDLFVRPIEFLFSIGMPLHQLLTKAADDYSSRLELFRETLHITGFKYTDTFQCSPNDLFKELSKMRHLTPADLLPRLDHQIISTPVARASPLPVYPHKNPQDLPEIPVTYFEADQKLENYRPHPYFPLPEHVKQTLLQDFNIQYGLTLMSEHELHKRVITASNLLKNETKWSSSARVHAHEMQAFPPSKQAKTSFYKDLPNSQSLSYEEANWTKTDMSSDPPWTQFEMSAHELWRITDNNTFTPAMKDAFMRTSQEHQTSTDSNFSTGKVYVKILPTLIFIASSLTFLTGPEDKRDSSFKISHNVFVLLAKMSYHFLTHRLPPRNSDWARMTKEHFYNTTEERDGYSINITCFLTLKCDRLVTITIKKIVKQPLQKPHYIMLPWIHFGNLYKIFRIVTCHILRETKKSSSPSSLEEEDE